MAEEKWDIVIKPREKLLSVDFGELAYSFLFMAVLLALGVVVFNKVQKSFMDTV